MELPQRLRGLRIVDGKLPGAGLPGLDERHALQEWRGKIGAPPFFVRFEDGRDAPLDEVQRLSRLGELWVDPGAVTADDAMDLAVAGARRIVVWTGAEGLAEVVEAMPESVLLGWDVARPGCGSLSAAIALAQQYSLPILIAARPLTPVEGVDAYTLEPGGEAWSLALQRIATVPTFEGEPEAGADAGAAGEGGPADGEVNFPEPQRNPFGF